jgi:hypothetical protein
MPECSTAPTPSSTATTPTRPGWPGQGAGDPDGGRRRRLADLRSAPAWFAVHPAEEAGRAELDLVCDDVAATVTALQAEGTEAARLVTDQSWGADYHDSPGGGQPGQVLEVERIDLASAVGGTGW